MVLFGACSLFSVVAAWPVSLARYVVSSGELNIEPRCGLWDIDNALLMILEINSFSQLSAAMGVPVGTGFESVLKRQSPPASLCLSSLAPPSVLLGLLLFFSWCSFSQGPHTLNCLLLSPKNRWADTAKASLQEDYAWWCPLPWGCISKTHLAQGNVSAHSTMRTIL